MDVTLEQLRNQTLEELTKEDKIYRSALQKELDEVGLLEHYSQAMKPKKSFLQRIKDKFIPDTREESFHESIIRITDQELLSLYKTVALEAYQASNAPYDKEPTEFYEKYPKWELVENEISQRGYETLSIEAFLGIGDWYEPDRPELGDKRSPNKKPKYYAQDHKERYPNGMREGHIDQVVHRKVRGYDS